MIHYLLQLLGISLAINGLLFLIAFWRKSDKLTDASYALSFITLASAAFMASQKTTYDTVLFILVLLWAVRIGSFLLYRVLRDGRDKRFDGMRNDFWKFGKFWLGQAITVWLLMVPFAVGMQAQGGWAALSVFAVVLWAIGFMVEGIADIQKYDFTHNTANKGRWIDAGIWRYSRHPNYFGEIVVWIAIYLYVLPGLSTFAALVGLISPLVITALLLGVSGIPILEKLADKRWGSVPAYRAYKKATRVLIPWPPRRKV